MEYVKTGRIPFGFQLKDDLQDLLEYLPSFLPPTAATKQSLGYVAEQVANVLDSEGLAPSASDSQNLLKEIDSFFRRLPFEVILSEVSHDDLADGLSCEFRDDLRETILTFKGNGKLIFSSLGKSGVQYGVENLSNEMVSEALLAILEAYRMPSEQLLTEAKVS